MAQINVVGYVMQDIVPKQSQRRTAYAHFFLKEFIGHNRSQSYQVWVWDELITKLIRFNIKKGSLIWVKGSLELTDYVTKDGQENIKVLKIKSSDFGVLRLSPATNPPAKPGNAESESTGLPVELDGDRNQLPE